MSDSHILTLSKIKNKINHVFMDAITVTEVYSNPQKWNGKEILVKGFLYQNSNGHFILSNEPNIPTCCLEKKCFIAVEGSAIFPSNKVQGFQGHLIVEKEIKLTHAKTVETALRGDWIVPLAGIIVLIYCFQRYFKRSFLHEKRG